MSATSASADRRSDGGSSDRSPAANGWSRYERFSREERGHERDAASAERKRLRAIRRTAKRAQETIIARASRGRREALNPETDAQRRKGQELAARDESRRLRKAANRTKARRTAG